MTSRWWIGLSVLVCVVSILWGVRFFSLRPCGLPTFVELEGGVCRVGSREGRFHEQPRVVSLSAFSMGRFEVTVGQFCRYMNEVSWEGERSPFDVEQVDGLWRPRRGVARHPVSGLRLDEARAYCVWLSGLVEGEVSLPTEEQWEYAARAGLRGGRFPWGWGGFKEKVSAGRLEVGSVGEYSPNAWGLYDMAGGVFEWCIGDASDESIARGGSYSEGDRGVFTVFRRTRFSLGYADRDVGFRVVRTVAGL